MAKNIITFTQARLRDLAIPETGRIEYWDTEITKLCLRVSKTGNKSFVINKWNAKTQQGQRVTLGKYPDINVTQARKMALAALSELSDGIDPTQKKRKAATKTTTLLEMLNSYLKNRDLKPYTVKDYRYKLKNGFENWQDSPITSITKDMILNRHTRITEEKGATTANTTFRVLRLVMNYAVAIGVIENNPVDIISQARKWHKNNRKERYIRPEQLKVWFEAVNKLEYVKAQTYLFTLIYMGARSSETLNLEWSNIDMHEQTLTLVDTKNRTDHTLPIPLALLEHYKRLRKVTGGNKWLFPNTIGTAPMTRPSKHINAVIKVSGVEFSPHDLRRTFASIAAEILPYPVVKKLLNHADGGDVTLGYVQVNIETLRSAVERISDVYQNSIQPKI